MHPLLLAVGLANERDSIFVIVSTETPDRLLLRHTSAITMHFTYFNSLSINIENTLIYV